MNDDSGEGGKSRKKIDRLVLDFQFSYENACSFAGKRENGS